MVRPTWWISQIIPPALLTYFGRTLYICVTEIGPDYLPSKGYPKVGKVYTIAASILIPTVTILFLRLYFLPSSQSVSPRDPPIEIRSGKVIFECISPAEAAAVKKANGDTEGTQRRRGSQEDYRVEALVNRCWRGKCGGRWKPARARHCSECGTCRAGFDHHCSFLANCLTAPYIPTFMCLVTLTPAIILLLAAPLFLPLGSRAVSAYKMSWSNQAIKDWWYGWKWSWVVAGGPVGRYIGGIILGWKELDRIGGGGGGTGVNGGMYRLEIGLLVGIGLILAMITSGLAFATARVIQGGHLTVDRERARSLSRARAAVEELKKDGKAVPPETLLALERLSDDHYFWIPGNSEGGQIVKYEGERGPYDRGVQGNWDLIMGKGWGWLLPWKALHRGLDLDACLNWPLCSEAEYNLKSHTRQESRVSAEPVG